MTSWVPGMADETIVVLIGVAMTLAVVSVRLYFNKDIKARKAEKKNQPETSSQ